MTTCCCCCVEVDGVDMLVAFGILLSSSHLKKKLVQKNVVYPQPRPSRRRGQLDNGRRKHIRSVHRLCTKDRRVHSGNRAQRLHSSVRAMLHRCRVHRGRCALHTTQTPSSTNPIARCRLTNGRNATSTLSLWTLLCTTWHNSQSPVT